MGFSHLNLIEILILYKNNIQIMSLIPIRCFTCGSICGNKWEKYKYILESGRSPSDAFAELGLRRYCCKRMLLGHIDLIDKLLLYSKIKDNDLDEKSVTK